jgi:hypothetical protein
MAIYVLIKTWSDKPMSVVGSYSMLQLGLLVIIKSMHELSSPRLNVSQAGGPGCNPFKIVQPCCSHISISHGARWFVSLSLLILAVHISSSFGARLAILVFQSPHITVMSSDGKHPIVSSTRLLAMASSTPRLFWLIMGGK